MGWKALEAPLGPPGQTKVNAKCGPQSRGSMVKPVMAIHKNSGVATADSPPSPRARGNRGPKRGSAVSFPGRPLASLLRPGACGPPTTSSGQARLRLQASAAKRSRSAAESIVFHASPRPARPRSQHQRPLSGSVLVSRRRGSPPPRPGAPAAACSSPDGGTPPAAPIRPDDAARPRRSAAPRGRSRRDRA